MFITAASTSTKTTGNWAASSSCTFIFLGFSAISLAPGDSTSLSFITPLSSNNFNALAALLASLGIAIVLFSFNSSNDFIDFEYNPIGSIWTFAVYVKSYPWPSIVSSKYGTCWKKLASIEPSSNAVFNKV